MSDKYEEFKEWLKDAIFEKEYVPFNRLNSGAVENIFYEFEVEYERIRKKTVLKDVILDNIDIRRERTHRNICVDIDSIYDELKEKRLLK